MSENNEDFEELSQKVEALEKKYKDLEVKVKKFLLHLEDKDSHGKKSFNKYGYSF